LGAEFYQKCICRFRISSESEFGCRNLRSKKTVFLRIRQSRGFRSDNFNDFHLTSFDYRISLKFNKALQFVSIKGRNIPRKLGRAFFPLESLTLTNQLFRLFCSVIGSVCWENVRNSQNWVHNSRMDRFPSGNVSQSPSFVIKSEFTNFFNITRGATTLSPLI
jgi:hypothetical protein